MNIPNVTKPRFRNPEAFPEDGFDLGFGPGKTRLYTTVFDQVGMRFLVKKRALYTHERFFEG
jgi:hypothetical protein